MTTSHVYDGQGNETGLWTANAAGVTLDRYTATYNRVGYRITNVEQDATRTTYTYSLAYQLLAEGRSGPNPYQLTYTYDLVGNRTRRLSVTEVTTYQYNAANELTKITAPSGAVTTVTYDGNGNTLGENTAGSLTSYTWDAENRLTNIDYPDGTSESAVYRRDGKRLRRTTGSGTTVYAWDRENVLLETDASLVVQAQYTDYPGMWGGLASLQRGASSSYYGFDPQWSTRILVSQAGTITDRYGNTAFGEDLYASGSTVNPYRYVGQYGYQRDTTLRQYVRARHLTPTYGRWISRDNAERRISNRYFYCDDQPTRLVDPNGRNPIAIIPIVIGGIIIGIIVVIVVVVVVGGQKLIRYIRWRREPRGDRPSCREVCRCAAFNPDLNYGGGGVICYKGKKCACLFDVDEEYGFPPIGMCPLSDNCGYLHEIGHFPDSPPWGARQVLGALIDS